MPAAGADKCPPNPRLATALRAAASGGATHGCLPGCCPGAGRQAGIPRPFARAPLVKFPCTSRAQAAHRARRTADVSLAAREAFFRLRSPGQRPVHDVARAPDDDEPAIDHAHVGEAAAGPQLGDVHVWCAPLSHRAVMVPVNTGRPPVVRNKVVRGVTKHLEVILVSPADFFHERVSERRRSSTQGRR